MRWKALVLAVFSVVAAILFYGDPAERMLLFTKNIALAGGLLVLSTSEAGALSPDA